MAAGYSRLRTNPKRAVKTRRNASRFVFMCAFNRFLRGMPNAVLAGNGLKLENTILQ